VAIDTQTQNPEDAEIGEKLRAALDLVKGQLEAFGFSCREWAVTETHPALCGVRAGTGGGRSLACNGHIDVVPAGESANWLHAPFGGEIVEGKLFGRGAADMKGGVVAMMFAAEAVRRAGVALAGDLFMHIVTDEEVVGHGTRTLVEHAPRPDAIIGTEPTELQLLPAAPGLEHFRLEFEGVESHAGNRWKEIHAGAWGGEVVRWRGSGNGEQPHPPPHQPTTSPPRPPGAGVNAIEKCLFVMARLRELEHRWGGERAHPLLPAGVNSLMPGLIEGAPGGGRAGRVNMHSNPGTVPNYCSVEYNLWYLPGETREEILAEIEAYLNTVCRLDPWLTAHPPRITWNLRNISFPPIATDAGHPLVRHLADGLRALGRRAPVAGFHAAADLAWYSAQGIPGTLFGPGSLSVCHAPNEFVPLDELIDCCKAIALAMTAWGGGSG
jgi:acetylornithine deacetylase/succinyl-diaminopimelate desuccinylase-like protein